MGGDEFCVLLAPTRRTAARTARRRRRAALSEHGEGFEIGAPTASSSLPARRPTPTEALQARRPADVRAQDAAAAPRARRGARASCSGRSPSATPTLRRPHRRRRPRSPRGRPRALGLAATSVDASRRAAELHDIGKIAIPDAILDKPGPLDAEEWELMRQHTVIGERIIGRRARAAARSPARRARATSAGTAAATPTAWPATRSRSARGSSPSATPSTR